MLLRPVAAALRGTLAACFSGLLISFASAATCQLGTTCADDYWGGDKANHTDTTQDRIGNGQFEVSSVKATRVDSSTLQIIINTAYAGVAGTAAALGTGYGDLFLTPGAAAWNPSGPAPYAGDTYQAGQWKYVFNIPTFASTGNHSVGAGTTLGLFQIINPVADVDLSFSNFGGTFRHDQAVRFDRPSGATSIGGGGYNINAGADTITFTIVDNGLLTDNFALSWAMTCGNDVIQAQFITPPGGNENGHTPLPGALLLMASALAGGAGFAKLRGLRRAA
jgi:hypothetical protein